MVEGTRAARYVSEFVGTYLLVFTVGCNVLCGNAVWAVTSIACMLMVSIYAFGSSSGAHFNPAVTAALAFSGKMTDVMDIGIYMIVQLVAGIAAGLTYGALFWKVMNLEPAKGFSYLETGLAEVLYTFLLCFVVLNCAASSKNNPPGSGNQFFGLAIGFSVVAGGYGAGAISGGAFNPAVAVGIDVSSAGMGFGWSLFYVLMEFVGACLAALLFWLVRPDDYGKTLKDNQYSLPVKCLSEFIGTYMLVVTVGLNVLAGSPAGAWSIAAALMCLVFSLGDVSGAHFNPAVTISILCSGRSDRTNISPLEAALYVGVQLTAGAVAALTYTAMHHFTVFPLEPKAPHGWAAALVGEAIFTFVLCSVVLAVATVECPLHQYFGLAIGSCVTAGGWAIGNISGGSLNPAVSFGISLSSLLGGHHAINFLYYTVVQLIGAVVAAAVFYVAHPSEYQKSRHHLLPGCH